MNKELKAELWEIQIILYWILTLLLFYFKHPILAWAILIWTLLVIYGLIRLLFQITKEKKVITIRRKYKAI